MSPPPAHKIEKPDTLEIWRKGVDAKLKEGETFFFTLQATVQGMASSQAEMRTDVRELRGQMSAHEAANQVRAQAEREDLAALRDSTGDGLAKVDVRLDAFASRQAEQGAQIGHLKESLDEIKAAEVRREADRKAADALRDEERKAQGEMLRRIDTALTARAAVEADRAAVSQPGDSPPLPSLSPTSPNLPALPPRRVPTGAIVGGTAGTVGLAVIGVFSNSPILQGGLAVAMGILAIGAVMWELKHYAPRA